MKWISSHRIDRNTCSLRKEAARQYDREPVVVLWAESMTNWLPFIFPLLCYVEVNQKISFFTSAGNLLFADVQLPTFAAVTWNCDTAAVLLPSHPHSFSTWCFYTRLTFQSALYVMCRDLRRKHWTHTRAWPAFYDCGFWVMMHFTDVWVPGCSVPLSLWKSVVIALAAAIWDGLKLRAWEQCIIKVGHAEKSRAAPKEGNKLKSGAGRSVLHLGHFKKEFQKRMIRTRLDMARQTAHTAGSVCHFVVPGSLISKCSCGEPKMVDCLPRCWCLWLRGRVGVQVLQILDLFKLGQKLAPNCLNKGHT